MNSNLLVGYKDSIVMYELKSGITVKTLSGFKFHKDLDDLFIISWKDGNGFIRNLENSLYFECNYPVKDFIFWNSRIITTDSLSGILQAQFIRRIANKIVACTRNSICLLEA